MKKVFLHGALGKRFGHEWDLNVSAPREAVNALFANEPLIEKYLCKKEEEGVFYGIKTSPDGDFLEPEERGLKTSRDLHVFPVPQGAGFAGSLVIMGLEMWGAMVINKKIAEAMERDEDAVAIQTQSYIYKGSDNRLEQGGTIPVGYGRMKVGSNVISSCILNYEFDSEKGDFVGFKDGMLNVIPEYSPYYIKQRGPLESSDLLNIFEGSSKFNTQDPAFQALRGTVPGTRFGANDGMYGGAVQSAAEVAAKAAQDAENVGDCETTEGSSLGGYFTYTLSFGDGVDTDVLPGWQHCGDWGPSGKTGVFDPARGAYLWNVSGRENAEWSNFTCLQSVPQLESSTADSVFYPINFRRDPGNTYLGATPITVGQRWVDGNKENGVGWYKLESVGVYKSVDLVCEGTIGGFSTPNGETVPFMPNANTDDAEVIARDSNGDPVAWRYPDDDYLQGIYLGEMAIKEVLSVSQSDKRDTYNIPEIDVDVGISPVSSEEGGELLIGADNQKPLEPQYQFTANTVEKGGRLYGHRSLTATDVLTQQGGQPIMFTPNTAYKQGSYVGVKEGETTLIYSVARSSSATFNRYENYVFNKKCNGRIVNKVVDRAQDLTLKETMIAGIGGLLSGPTLEFYAARDNFGAFSGFESQLSSYIQDDTFFEPNGPSGTHYYKLGEDATGLLGDFDSSQSYNQGGSILFVPNSAVAYKITGSYLPGDTVAGQPKRLNQFAELMSWVSPATAETEAQTRYNPVLYTLSKNVPNIVEEVDISPGSTIGGPIGGGASPAEEPEDPGVPRTPINVELFKSCLGLTDLGADNYESDWFFTNYNDGDYMWISPLGRGGGPGGGGATRAWSTINWKNADGFVALTWIYLAPHMAAKDSVWFTTQDAPLPNYVGWQWTSKEIQTSDDGRQFTFNNATSTLGSRGWLEWRPTSTVGSMAIVWNHTDSKWLEVVPDSAVEVSPGAPPADPDPIDIPLSSQDAFWTRISINGTNNITNMQGARVSSLEEGGDCPMFRWQMDLGTASQVRRVEEEYYLSHTVINPLVEEVYVSLSLDELGYIYGGDNVEVTYKLGKVLGGIIGAVFTAGMASSFGVTSWAALGAWAAVGYVVGEYIGENASFDIGTKVENTGETWPTKGKFRIKYGNEGEEAYFTDIYFYGVATSPYRKDVKIYLPSNPAGKDRTIKVYKLNRERNPVKEGEQAARYKENFSLGSVTEIVRANLNYPNSVVIGTRVNARDWPDIPERNYNLKLKRVAVPSNYNPKTREYNGNWNGLFSGQSRKEEAVGEEYKKWTDNPAWCLYDLISNKRYGAGKFGIKEENIDRWTLYKIAKYCDQLIPTGYSSKYPRRAFTVNGSEIELNIPAGEEYTGSQFYREFNWINKTLAIFYNDGTYESRTIRGVGQGAGSFVITLDAAPSGEAGSCATEIDYPLIEPRYTLNAYLMTPQNAFKLINEFAAIFRTYAYWAGNAIHFFQDEERDAVMLFTNNNISADGFAYTSTPKTSRTNSCKIKYLDRYNNYRPKMEHAENRDQILKNNIIEQSVDGFGITSKAQAKRAAEFIIQGAALETESVAFKTSALGSYLRPGDVIDVLDNKRTVGRFAGKVLRVDVSGDGKRADIDIDFPIRTIIDENNKDTWKKITLYNIEGNQTIESLDAQATTSTVSDQDITDMRAGQIGQYVVSHLSQNDTRLRITHNPYELVTGSYTWPQALVDARKKGGMLATIDNSVDQSLVGAVLPTGSVAWVGGYYKVGRPVSDYFAWFQPQECTTDAMAYTGWEPGYPTGTVVPLETDALEPIITDDGDFIVVDGEASFVAVSGSSDPASHGNWINLPGTGDRGYILEKKDCSSSAQDSSLMSLGGMEGTSFILDDKVNLAVKKQYKVLGISEESNGIFQIHGMQYNSGKFGNIEDNASLPAPVSPVIFTEKLVDAPAGVALEVLEPVFEWQSSSRERRAADPWPVWDEDENIYTQITPYGLRATWDRVAAASAYRIQFFDGNVILFSAEAPNSTDDPQSFSYRNEKIIPGGSYYVRVYSLP